MSRIVRSAPLLSVSLIACLVAIAQVTAPDPTAAAWPGSKPFRNGEEVQFTGSVTDSSGRPIVGVEVRLEASRRSFSYTRMRKLRYNTVVVAVETDGTGQFRIDWTWHNYYNHFSLSAVIPVRKPGGVVEPHMLASSELSHDFRHGSPVVTSLTVADTDFFEKLRDFEATVDTADEQRVYQEQGKPDRVDRVDQAGLLQEAWWYFELGSLYRFSEGALVDVESFEAVRGFDSPGR